MELLFTPSPAFIPGYTGFCPQYKFRIGDTYGTCTHKILLDPEINHAEKIVLTNKKPDSSLGARPPQSDIDIVNARSTTRDTIYHHPIIPGYNGFVPKELTKFGERFTVQATGSLAEFERSQIADLEASRQLYRLVELQNGKWNPKSLEDKEKTTTKVKLPLVQVRPECAGISNLPKQRCISSNSPYFMDNTDPEKKFIKGFAGHVPCGYPHFGKCSETWSNSALCNFTEYYRKRLSTEFSPIRLEREPVIPKEQFCCIYHEDSGQLPKYTGHIPGDIFRIGMTFGNSSKGVKETLRRQQSKQQQLYK